MSRAIDAPRVSQQCESGYHYSSDRADRSPHGCENQCADGRTNEYSVGASGYLSRSTVVRRSGRAADGWLPGVVYSALHVSSVRRRGSKSRCAVRGRSPRRRFFSVRCTLLLSSVRLARARRGRSNCAWFGAACRRPFAKHACIQQQVVVVAAAVVGNCHTSLGGGSLGSCVDEERSQLRELM